MNTKTRLLICDDHPLVREVMKDVLHEASGDDKLLLFDDSDHGGRIAESRGHRAIGVVYRPERERYGNYVPTVLPRRYDAFLFLDRTQALHPLHDVQPLEKGEVPETYPAGV